MKWCTQEQVGSYVVKHNERVGCRLGGGHAGQSCFSTATHCLLRPSLAARVANVTRFGEISPIGLLSKVHGGQILLIYLIY